MALARRIRLDKLLSQQHHEQVAPIIMRNNERLKAHCLVIFCV